MRRLPVLLRLWRAIWPGPEPMPTFTPPARHADLRAGYGARVRYSPGMGPGSYVESRAVAAAKKARKASETGRPLRKRRRPPVSASVVPIRRQG